MQKIKLNWTYFVAKGLLGLVLFIGLVLFAFPNSANAAEEKCFQENKSGNLLPQECKNGDPTPKCEVESEDGVVRTVDCSTIDPNKIIEPKDLDLGLGTKISYGTELNSGNYCGKGDKQVQISFDIGCLGESYDGEQYNPVLDMLFALLRFVSTGVGIVVTGSIVWAGIQYSTSRGNPQGTEAALKRVYNSVIALLIYIFAFAILNFLVPGGLFV